MTEYYMHPGDITTADIDRAVREAREAGYPAYGYRWDDGGRVSLRWLANLWAEQESECEPEDRGGFAWWLEDHMNTGIVTPVFDAERMRRALHETLKYYDEAGESGRDYVLDPDSLGRFAADLCNAYENDNGTED